MLIITLTIDGSNRAILILNITAIDIHRRRGEHIIIIADEGYLRERRQQIIGGSGFIGHKCKVGTVRVSVIGKRDFLHITGITDCSTFCKRPCVGDFTIRNIDGWRDTRNDHRGSRCRRNTRRNDTCTFDNAGRRAHISL